MVYPATPQIGLGLPTTYAHSHMPIRDISPYSTQSVRLNIPRIPHLDTPSSPFPDNQISVDVGSWSRDVGLSIRTESSPSSSIFNPTDNHVEDSALDTDSGYSPHLSPSNSEYHADVDYPPLRSPSDSDNNLDTDSTPRASDRLDDYTRQPSNTPHIDIHSPYSDATTVCDRTAHDSNHTTSVPNTERIITPLPDSTVNTAHDTDFSENSDLGTSTTGLNPNSKSFVPSYFQATTDTARRIIRYDRTTGQFTYADEPLSNHQYQTTLPRTSRSASVHQGQRPLEAARVPPIVQVNRPYGPPPNLPPGFQHNLPPGLPIKCYPSQHGPPPGLPFNPPPRIQPGPPPGLPINFPPRFQPGPPPGLAAYNPPRFHPGPLPGLPATIPPRFRPDPPPGFLPRPHAEPQHHATKPVGKQVACEPYRDFEHVVPNFIKDYALGQVDIHPHRFIPREEPIDPQHLAQPIPSEGSIDSRDLNRIPKDEPVTPPPHPSPEPIEPVSPGPPPKTIYMIRAGRGRSSFFEAKARALHIPHCPDIPIRVLGYNPSLSRRGKRQVEDLCEQTVANIQASAQLLVTSPQCRAMRTTAALFPLCRRLFKPNMVPVSRPIKALGLLNDTRPKPSIPLDLLAALCPDPRSQLYFGLKFDYTHINVFSSTSRNSTEDPLKEVRERAKVMRQWLWDRPESVIVVVSHNDFMHHMVDFGERLTKWDYCQIREFTMFNGVEGYGPSLAEVPLDLSGPPREAPKSLLERIEERKMMCHVEESC